ncbi:Fructose-1-6-bisphosphatase class 1, C-terminal [Dillenia turbinata]|uniref:fructose-bisphosphatase n=1 Tax=Dillenia turbinata TaxID=194707 RepID=A0AAN8W7Y9_9MAGN
MAAATSAAAIAISSSSSSRLLHFSNSASDCQLINPFRLEVSEAKSFISSSSPQTSKRRHGVHCMAVGTTEAEMKKNSGYEIQTLTSWLLKQEQACVIDAELTIVISSISMACKQIASLVQRASISNLTGVQGAVNVQGEDQKKLDVVSNAVFSNCLRSSGRTGIIASEEEDVPVAVEESYSGNYIVVFDPLDGSSNSDAAVSTGSIFGIYSPNDECLAVTSDDSMLSGTEQRCVVSVCQPGSNLLAAGYCMYSSSVIFVLSVGKGVFAFTLDPMYGEFVLTQENLQIPRAGKIYAIYEGNYQLWDDKLKKYIDDLKDPGPSGKPYSARYIGSLVVEQAGGRGSDGHQRILDIQPTEIHQRVPFYIGSVEEVEKLEKYLQQAGYIDAELTIVLSSISLACKQIASLLQRSSIINLTGLQGTANVQGEDQKKLDVISNELFCNCLRSSGRTGIIASEEEDVPVAVEETYSGNYIVVFDPIDGFGCQCRNVQIFNKMKIDQAKQECVISVCQPGSNLLAAGYCLYSSSVVLTLSIGGGVYGFTLDPNYGEFVLTHEDIKIPKTGRIYSFNEGNYDLWDEKLESYLNHLRQPGATGKPYSGRYIGCLVGEIHRMLLVGGIYGNPKNTNSKKGNLRLFYECAPMSFLVEQAGGKAIDGHQRILDIKPQEIHQRMPIFIESADEVEKLEKHLA